MKPCTGCGNYPAFCTCKRPVVIDEDTATLLEALCQELDYYVGSDEPGNCLDSGDAERLITEARQKIHVHDSKQFDIVPPRPPRVFKVDF